MVVDLTDDDGKTPSSSAMAAPVTADSREVLINKLSGKTYPSLVVVARPNLRVKDISQAVITSERTALGLYHSSCCIIEESWQICDSV